MKRTVPLFITAIVGFVLIISQFIPATVSWGEVAAVWFDILAAIAFILGGGNLLMSHLKKISDNRPGWGFSAVTLIAFFATLVFGLWKFGTRPQPIQEHFGESFAPLGLEDFPESQVARVRGRIPWRPVDPELPASVRSQLQEEDGELVFVGWMTGDQRQDLLGYRDHLDWQCRVEELADAAKPPAEGLKQYVNHHVIAFDGSMTAEQKATLLAVEGANDAWRAAINRLFEEGQRETAVTFPAAPPGFDVPESLSERVSIETTSAGVSLTLQGPLSASDRDSLVNGYEGIKPYDAARRDAFVADLKSNGDLNAKQEASVRKVLAGTWTAEQLRTAIDNAGVPKETTKTYCEMVGLREAGVDGAIDAKTPAVGESVKLSDAQVEALRAYTADPGPPNADSLVAAIEAAGPFEQAGAVNAFLDATPTLGELKEAVYYAAIQDGPLTEAHRTFLLTDIRAQRAWKDATTELFHAAHVVKYPWSGDYSGQGSPFWWIYEYLLKPLTATMFAMLAFYVASAAFRAFRAKNLEAILLLGTAFIILLGRTPAGVLMTSWLPDSLSGLRIENLSIYVMVVFNTAGNRAIMIGIALGIASTSLKVLLGVDRSYLGSQD